MTRDPARIPEVLETIKKIWEKNPDLRLMQLLMNTQLGYYSEDNYLLERLRQVYMTIDADINTSAGRQEHL